VFGGVLVEQEVDLTGLDGKEVIVTGKYNDQTNMLAAKTVKVMNWIYPEQSRRTPLANLISPVVDPLPTATNAAVVE